jgi:hypothetical protein
VDSLTKEAMELFEIDKKEFPKRLAKQNQSAPKTKTVSIDSGKKLTLIKLRAKAILIKQKQLRNVAGLGSHPKIRTIL